VDLPFQVQSVACGGNPNLAFPAGHTCVISGGDAYCWGANGAGQLGTGGTGLQTPTPQPVIVLDQGAVLSVTAGRAHACAVQDASPIDVWCWGDNQFGQLGIGSDTDSATPVWVSDNGDTVSAGFHHSCGITTLDRIYCWGSRESLQLGDGANPPFDNCSGGDCSVWPVPIDLDKDMAAVSAGWQHSCAVTTDGEVWCWGSNQNGQVGAGTTVSVYQTPTQVLGLTNAVAVSAGSRHTCALASDGNAWCWGDNNVGQLGVGAATADASTPQLVLMP
jgi:alpha-tubulin suppressor-like RCC1 family protein